MTTRSRSAAGAAGAAGAGGVGGVGGVLAEGTVAPQPDVARPHVLWKMVLPGVGEALADIGIAAQTVAMVRMRVADPWGAVGLAAIAVGYSCWLAWQLEFTPTQTSSLRWARLSALNATVAAAVAAYFAFLR